MMQTVASPAELTAGYSATEVETFSGRWPGVLIEMKDFIDLSFLAQKHSVAAVRIFISRALVPQQQLQPHMREFKASFGALPTCRIELKGTDAPAHKIEIEYRKD
jgi:hypothetical protein